MGLSESPTERVPKTEMEVMKMEWRRKAKTILRPDDNTVAAIEAVTGKDNEQTSVF